MDIASNNKDFFSRFLNLTEDDTQRLAPGEQPATMLERASAALAKVNGETAAAACNSGKPQKGVFILRIEVVVAPSNGANGRCQAEHQVSIETKLPKHPKIKAQTFVDTEGSILDKEARQMRLEDAAPKKNTANHNPSGTTAHATKTVM